MKIAEDRVFDLMVDLVEFAGAHGLPQTALALEGALDAFLADRGLVPRALPAPGPESPAARPPASPPAHSRPVATVASPRAAVAGAVPAPFAGPLPAVPPAVPSAVLAAIALPDPSLSAAMARVPVPAFQSCRAPDRPRRLHLLPTQRVAD